MSDPVALRVRNVTKRFPGVIALDRVAFDLQCGEIHALLGENGAGKSTLLKILTGIYQPDEGNLVIRGRSGWFATPAEAYAAGVTIVPQDVLMVPRLSIGRNVLLGVEKGQARRGRLSDSEYGQVERAFAKIGLDVGPEAIAGTLSVPQLRLAQIARCLLKPGEIVILDEPTAALSEPDAAHLLENLQALRREGKAIIYVTHRLSEVIQIADRATILRDGRVAGQFSRPLERARLVEAMTKSTSRSASAPPVSVSMAVASASLKVDGLSVDRWVEGVSFEARPGSIVGIAGVQGSGHGQLLWAIANALPRKSGTVQLAGSNGHGASVVDTYRAGIVLVPADRRNAAIVPRRSIADNIAISGRAFHERGGLGLRSRAAEAALAREYIDRFDIRPRDISARAGFLSGGNQQKVAIARAVASKPRVLLIEEPTQGVDIGAKAEIHALLRQIAAETGCIVIVASSEFEELIALCATIHVMRLGRLVHSCPSGSATYRDILEHALP
ncbi:sugar ABC transporter ATP-binding protein [Rhodoligotrophos defluvii]|uniref:sugar ABC transporter ATP-binding protein n=1 Tax=Rhodoligotrophos defluvii TaxID=2561934 RepID=UPI001484E867|nr:sugar ABC transporter ATP-binding protein [Rhodoligotrophos defluvii]